MTEEIKEKFLKDFIILGKEKVSPYVILFDAYTGMGKSTVARTISKYDESVILNNDEIRMWLKNNDLPTSLKDELQTFRLEELLNKNISCIHDSCFCHNWQKKKQYYDENNIKYYIIRIECKRETVEERLKTRTVDGINFSTATFNDYLWMAENVERIPEEYIDFVINTEENIEEQVLEFLKQNNLDN